MKITRAELAQRCGVGEDCIRTYLCRAEFTKCHTKHSYLLEMELEDIERMKELIRNRIGSKNNKYTTFEGEE